MKTETNEFLASGTIKETPKVVGWYRFGKSKTMTTKIGIYYKPNFIHRFFMKICLGLYWENEIGGEQ
jgi:hypothetical protein